MAGGYGRTYTLLYRQWIYGAPHVDIVMAVTLSVVAWWGRVPTHAVDTCRCASSESRALPRVVTRVGAGTHHGSRALR